MSANTAIFIHPEDRAALEHLKAMPLLPSCVKLFMKAFTEQTFHGLNMAGKIRLGPDQLPRLYRRLPPICEKLGIPEPEFYLGHGDANAYALGDTRTAITITSGLVACMDEEELDAVIAHECGHIACRHMLYHTMAHLLCQYGLGMLGPLRLPVTPIVWALLYWNRRGELSADRAAAYVMGSATPVVESMARFSGGPKYIAADLNIDRYLEQANSYDRLLETTWDKFLQTCALRETTHPFAAVRAKEIAQWCNQPEFQALVDRRQQNAETTACTKCGQMLRAGWEFCIQCGQPAQSQSNAEGVRQNEQTMVR